MAAVDSFSSSFSFGLGSMSLGEQVGAGAASQASISSSQSARKKRGRDAFEAAPASPVDDLFTRNVKQRAESERSSRSEPQAGGFHFTYDTLEERRSARSVLGKRKLGAFNATDPTLDRPQELASRDAFVAYINQRNLRARRLEFLEKFASTLPRASGPLAMSLDSDPRSSGSISIAGGTQKPRVETLDPAAQRRKLALADKRVEAWKRSHTLSRVPDVLSMSLDFDTSSSSGQRISQATKPRQVETLDLDAAVRKSELDEARRESWNRFVFITSAR